MALCPLISSRERRATCGKLNGGAGIPALSVKEHYCFDIYELCPLFLSYSVKIPVEDDVIEKYKNSYIDLSR